MMVAEWRRFEEASIEERENMVTWGWATYVDAGEEWTIIFGLPRQTKEKIVEHWIERNQVSQKRYNILRLKWFRWVKRDEKWYRIRHSFYSSTVWKKFRKEWLKSHSRCNRCKQTDAVLHIHHTDYWVPEVTVLEEGFLESLKHPERFETLCPRCHRVAYDDASSGRRWLEK